MGLGGLTWHHKEVGMKWQFDDWERWFSWGLVMKQWEFSQSSAMVNNWDFTFKIQAFLPCRCCLDSCRWRNLSTNNGMVNVVHLHMHSSSPEQNLPDFQVHKTLDSLDATGAVSDIPQKDRVRVSLRFMVFLPLFRRTTRRTMGWTNTMMITMTNTMITTPMTTCTLIQRTSLGWSKRGIWMDMEDPVQWQMICVKKGVLNCFEVLVNLAWTYHLPSSMYRISTPYWGGRTPIHQLSYFDVESSGSTSDFWLHWRGWNPDISDK